MFTNSHVVQDHAQTHTHTQMDSQPENRMPSVANYQQRHKCRHIHGANLTKKLKLLYDYPKYTIVIGPTRVT